MCISLTSRAWASHSPTAVVRTATTSMVSCRFYRPTWPGDGPRRRHYSTSARPINMRAVLLLEYFRSPGVLMASIDCGFSRRTRWTRTPVSVSSLRETALRYRAHPQASIPACRVSLACPHWTARTGMAALKRPTNLSSCTRTAASVTRYFLSLRAPETASTSPGGTQVKGMQYARYHREQPRRIQDQTCRIYTIT